MRNGLSNEGTVEGTRTKRCKRDVSRHPFARSNCFRTANQMVMFEGGGHARFARSGNARRESTLVDQGIHIARDPKGRDAMGTNAFARRVR